MRFTQLILITPYLINFGECIMEPFVVGGQEVSVVQFPHSAFLYINCVRNEGPYGSSVCGSSIVNQYLMLTAAHCTDKCTSKTSITAYVGHELWYLGASSTAHSFLQHEGYGRQQITNDICLVRLKTPLKFTSMVNRVALMKAPPYNEDALAAGWGRYNLTVIGGTDALKSVTQYVRRDDDCPGDKDPGFFCTLSTEGHPAKGDSGSALVVRKYIQIGIVSHALIFSNNRTIFYTDTGYYYDWIQKNSAQLFCSDGGPDPPSSDNPLCAMAVGRGGGE